MYQVMTKFFLLFCYILLLISCTKPLRDIPGNTENVNGFKVEWRANVSESKRSVIRDILNDMQFVHGGTFLMGATQEQEPYARINERPAHYVKVSDYYICRNEISVEQVEVLTDTEFSSYEKTKGAPKYVWSDWKNLLALIQDYANITMDFPTEAQWEFAARGGLNGNGFIYSGGDTISCAENTPNELGLVGMARCHSEWCKDAYNAYSGVPLCVDPYCVQGLGHIVRGGNSRSTKEINNYNKRKESTFLNDYEDVRSCRVSSRSYCEDSQAYLGVYISCRFVINL